MKTKNLLLATSMLLTMGRGELHKKESIAVLETYIPPKNIDCSDYVKPKRPKFKGNKKRNRRR